MWQEISRIGKKLVQSGLVEANFGNISVKSGDKIYITKSGCFLDTITVDDVIPISLYGTCALDLIASSECIVHREIYNNTTATCIIHVHCTYAVTLSLIENQSIVPIDSEGELFLKSVPIVNGSIGSTELAMNLSKTLKSNKMAVICGHGTFAVGKTLDEAYTFTAQIEHSSKIKYLYKLMKNRD